MNTYCKNNKCVSLLKDYFRCNNSYECQFNSYCDKKDNVCKKLFSIKDDEEIFERKGNYKNFDEICKSGGYIKNNKNNITCQTLYNINYQCDHDICKYKPKNPPPEKTTNENCFCGYNK